MKFAHAGYHRALAMSHLAEQCRASGDLSRALGLAEDASIECPDKAKFFFELARYAALSHQDAKMQNALRSAIKNDWAYWGVVLTEPDFKQARESVFLVLEDIRQAERRVADRSLAALRQVLDGANETGAGTEVSDSRCAFERLAQMAEQSTVFCLYTGRFREKRPNGATKRRIKQFVLSSVSWKHCPIKFSRTNSTVMMLSRKPPPEYRNWIISANSMPAILVRGGWDSSATGSLGSSSWRSAHSHYSPLFRARQHGYWEQLWLFGLFRNGLYRAG